MSEDRYAAGLEARRAVLGDDYVDAALAATDELGRDLQELVTEFGWGAFWTRPGLDRPTRSLVTVAMLTALGREHELRLHLRGALRNGCSREQLVELLLHAVPYCGFPAAIDAFRTLREVLAEPA